MIYLYFIGTFILAFIIGLYIGLKIGDAMVSYAVKLCEQQNRPSNPNMF